MVTAQKTIKPILKKTQVRNEDKREERKDYILQRRILERPEEKEEKYDYVVISLRRTAKVMEGGKRMRFSAMVAIGDRNGRLGIAIGKAPEPRLAIEKARRKAKKALITVPLVHGTLPCSFTHKFKASKIFVRPAKSGTGIIAGSAIRSIFDLVGVKDVCSKIYGSRNPITNVYCLYEALKNLKPPSESPVIRSSLKVLVKK